MCPQPRLPQSVTAAATPALIPADTNREALREADAETALRRRRAGAAANILTGPRGIPSQARLGSV